MTALATTFACVSWINRDDRNSGQSRLIFHERAKLSKGPLRHAVTLRLPEPGSLADARQIFQSNTALSVCSFLNDAFGYRVVGILFEAALSTAQSLQLATDRFRALARLLLSCCFALKTATHFLIVLTCLLNLRAGIDFAIRISRLLSPGQSGRETGLSALPLAPPLRFVHLPAGRMETSGQKAAPVEDRARPAASLARD